jgi:hypothetical protein
LNDPLPEVRIRSAHLVGVRSATPRLNLSGPLIRNRLYFLNGTEYLMHEDQVRTLFFPVNETKSTAVNSFGQFDGVLTGKQTITATLHFAPHTVQYANLNFFDPQPVTPNSDYQEDTVGALLALLPPVHIPDAPRSRAVNKGTTQSDIRHDTPTDTHEQDKKGSTTTASTTSDTVNGTVTANTIRLSYVSWVWLFVLAGLFALFIGSLMFFGMNLSKLIAVPA